VIKRQTEPNQLSAILALAPHAVVHKAPFRLLPVLVQVLTRASSSADLWSFSDVLCLFFILALAWSTALAQA
jgi:hypothetical protein